jgi:lysophospholipase L1-like esterase
MSENIVLLGDSIFDNAHYVPGEPCVTEQLRAVVRDGVQVSMLAVDGDYVADVHAQLKSLPKKVTHLFVSAGGNDALRFAHKLANDYLSSEDLLREWSGIQKEFRRDYRAMLQAVLKLRKHTAVCTIYDAVPSIDETEVTALSLFNDVITAEAIYSGIPVVDLRWVCTEPSDYSPLSPIEPSSRGGAKIAATLNRVFEEHDFSSKRTSVFT